MKQKKIKKHVVPRLAHKEAKQKEKNVVGMKGSVGPKKFGVAESPILKAGCILKLVFELRLLLKQTIEGSTFQRGIVDVLCLEGSVK